jgi:hypothetical protein
MNTTAVPPLSSSWENKGLPSMHVQNILHFSIVLSPLLLSEEVPKWGNARGSLRVAISSRTHYQDKHWSAEGTGCNAVSSSGTSHHTNFDVSVGAKAAWIFAFGVFMYSSMHYLPESSFRVGYAEGTAPTGVSAVPRVQKPSIKDYRIYFSIETFRSFQSLSLYILWAFYRPVLHLEV